MVSLVFSHSYTQSLKDPQGSHLYYDKNDSFSDISLWHLEIMVTHWLANIEHA